ncbi:uncharacterized protein LOC144564401 [Carex rostrata]
MVLTGVIPKYIMPVYNSDWDIAGGVSVSEVQRAVKEICHRLCTPVIADEAHGAHFRFNKTFPRSALEQGADLTVQFTHKVLSSLTQSLMLHLSGDLVDPAQVSKCLQLLQSTSPNYLLLASLDAARAQLADEMSIFDKTVNLAIKARKLIREIPGITLLDLSYFGLNSFEMDPLRITIGTSRLGLSDHVSNNILYENYKIIPVLVGTRSLTFALNLGTRYMDVERLILGVKHLSNKFFHENSRIISICNARDSSFEPFESSQMELTPRDEFFAKRRVSTADSIGKICGDRINLHISIWHSIAYSR